jgi:histidyl-tRNA synthetase
LNVDFVFDGNFKKQMKKSSQNNARFVIIIGEEEMKNNEVVVKDFDNAKEQKVKQELLIHYLQGKI